MLMVELEKDELADSGAFVKIGCVAGAIARTNGSGNLTDAERKIFPRINAGVQKNILNPLDPDTHEPLSRSDYGIGIVPFAELVDWGHATKLYDFKRPDEQAAPDKPKLKGGRPKTLDKKANAVHRIIELFEKTAGIKFEPGTLPGGTADLFDACQRIEKAKTGKCDVFCITRDTFCGWLKSAGYGFSPGRPPAAEERYWTGKCPQIAGLIAPGVFTGVYGKETP